MSSYWMDGDVRSINRASYTSSGPIAVQSDVYEAARQFRFSSRRQSTPGLTILKWYAASDALAFVFGFCIAWGIASLAGMAWFKQDNAAGLAEFEILAAAVLLWFQQTGHYRTCMPFWIEVKKIVAAMACTALVYGFLQFASPAPSLWLVTAWMVAAPAMIVWRNVMRACFKKKGYFQLRTLMVGAGVTARHTREALASDPCLAYTITAQINDLPKSFLQAGRSWETLCAMHDADYVIIALDGPELALAEQPLAQLARESIPFSVSPPHNYLPVTGLSPQYFLNHDVMLLAYRNGLEQTLPCFLKRLLDISVSAAALVVLSPLMLALALWVKSDGGPAFYAHTRLGRDRKPFPCLKFRSMVMDGDAILKRHLAENLAARKEWESTQKLVNDPRVTKVGKFLRSTSLDELPQLINVLRGEMSLVGPRPIVNNEVAKYDGDIAHYCRVRPGVTGLWQVSGRSDVSYPRRVHMDSWYVRNWSLWHDLAILCKTIPALLNRTGAY